MRGQLLKIHNNFFKTKEQWPTCFVLRFWTLEILKFLLFYLAITEKIPLYLINWSMQCEIGHLHLGKLQTKHCTEEQNDWY